MRAPASALVNGVEFAYLDEGRGPMVVLLHETAATARIWEPLIAALGDGIRAVAPDRRGWGDTGTPEGHVRSSVEEHAEDAAGLLDELGAEEAVVCGAGVGAVVALDLVLRRPRRARAAVLIEPPLLALLPQATEGIASDRESIEAAVRDGGPAAAMAAYLAGGLPFLGAGAERIPAEVAAAASARPLSLFAELAAVPAWAIRGPQLLAAESPSLVVTGAATPPVLRSASQELAARLGGSRTVRLGGAGLPHVDAAPELAREIRALAAA